MTCRNWRSSGSGLFHLALLAALSLVALPGGGRAQPEADATAAKPPQQLESIPLAEVAVRAENVDATLRTIEERLKRDPRVANIEAQLPERRRLLAGKRDALLALLKEEPGHARLADERSQWTRYADELAAWQTALSERAAELDSTVEELQDSRALWERTREQAVAQRAPSTLLRRIRSTQAELADAAKRVKERLGSVLTLQENVGQAVQLVSAAQQQLQGEEAQLRERMFKRDAAPLWTEILGFAGPKARVAGLRAALEANLANLREFARAHVAGLVLQLLLFAVALKYAHALSRRVSRWTEDDPDLGGAAAIFARPASIALLLVLISVFAFHPDAPQIMRHLLGLLMLIPFLRLLPPLIARLFHPLLYALAAFYVVFLVHQLVSAAPLLARLIFDLELIAAIAVLLWLMRPSRLRLLPPGVRLSPALVVGIRLALVLLVASLAANLLGYATLSEVFGSGVLIGGYLAMALFGAVRVVEVSLRVTFRTRRAQLLGVVQRRGDVMLRLVTRATRLAAIALWTFVMVERLAVRGPVARAFASILSASLKVGAIDVSLGDVLAFALTIFAAFAISRVIRFVLEEDLFTRIPLNRGIANSIATLLHYVVLALGFMLALAAAGMDFSRLTLLAGAFGVGLGFGLQNVVNNFVSGLILLFERPVQTGDMIEVGGVLGEVRRIGIRSSTVRTFDGAEVIIPNGTLISDQVINWTLSDRRRRIDVSVGVAYGTDPVRVQELLLAVANGHEAVLDDPRPLALFMGFGDSSLDFLLRAWIPRFEEGFTTRSDLAVAINAALREAGIEIPFPQRDLHLRSVAPAAAGALGRNDPAK